jgi:hypothetical protein
VGFPSADSFPATPRSQSVLEDFALPNIKHCDDGGRQMRKSFVALALLVGAATMLTTLAFAQQDDGREGAALKTPALLNQMKVTKAARLGTSLDTDTMFVGHKAGAFNATNNYWSIGTSLGTRPDGAVPSSYDGMWDFDVLTNGAGTDSAQGWVPFMRGARNPGTAIPDASRPALAVDMGNKMNAPFIQNHTAGIISAWHADDGQYLAATNVATDGSHTDPWTALVGTKSAWCGLRSGDDFAVVDDPLYGGTGNCINGNALFGTFGSNSNLQGGKRAIRNFPGYANQWDQLLYRDVRVASGAALTVNFQYATQMSNNANRTAATAMGWFDKDPLLLQQGGTGYAASNFISASVNTALAPIDSFMVYVGVPTDPTNCKFSDSQVGEDPRSIFDMKRRWFSEVISIDKHYAEILSTFGVQSATSFSQVVPNAVIEPMLVDQGIVNGGGIIRVVFRVKTNNRDADDTNTGGGFTASTGQGAVRLDAVEILGGQVSVTCGFENPGDINNNIELATTGATLGPDVGEGYALSAWHATGKPPYGLLAHLHPLDGDPGRGYNPLAYADLCGVWDSPDRQCDINGVVLSTTDHDLFEAAGGSVAQFKDNQGGMMSPAISLIGPFTGPGSTNVHGLDLTHINTSKKWLAIYDMYTGLFKDLYSQGNLYSTTLVSYPTLQKNGHYVWGDMGVLTSVSWWGDRYCFKLADEMNGLINTSNASGVPDSVKVAMFRQQRSIEFGTGASSTDGHYTDNMSLAFPPGPTGGLGQDHLDIDIWDWYSDAFPRNEEVATATTAFDTCGALIFSARQMATATTDANRPNISADSMYLKGTVSSANEMRVDCIFRIFPGPGNYVIVGDKTSGVRKVPTSVTPATGADVTSFFDSYMANPGLYSKGTHGVGTWNVDTWNSVRCDTVETNIFPAEGCVGNLPGIRVNNWASMIYDGTDDPDDRLGTVAVPHLGIVKNRCWLQNPAAGQSANSTNIKCDWDLLTPAEQGNYPPSSGIPAEKRTVEYTKIFPDGLLTPGSTIQYFFRMGVVGGGVGDMLTMTPDTNRVFLQPNGTGHDNFDGQRWANISILPDKWKDDNYGGMGKACLLVVDQQDRRGNERIWVGIADSIGATVKAKYGAHNGWHAEGGYRGTHGTISNPDFSYTSETNCGTDPNIAVWANGGQPGTTWDLYNVTSIESPSGCTTQLGGRLAPLASGYQTGKDTKQGPTASMLNDYYECLFFMCGDMSGGYFGPTSGVGSQDVALVENFLLDRRLVGGEPTVTRGVWFMGDGFIEGNEWKDDETGPESGDFVWNWLGIYGYPEVYNYYSYAGCSGLDRVADLFTDVAVLSGDAYGLLNPCTTSHEMNLPSFPGVTASTYMNHGACTDDNPCVAGVATAYSEAHPYYTLMDGWNLNNLYSKHSDGQEGSTSFGRLAYFMDVSTNVFASCGGGGFMGTPTVDVPTNTVKNVNIDFLGNVWNNPVKVGGNAIINFGLAKSDLVDVKVYDVTGRLVKTLANRQAFKAGPSKLVWDGRNDQGQAVARGVYFTQVKFINSGFVDAKKVTVLK